MNTRLLRILAVLLAVGAIVAAYVGVRLSSAPPPAPAPVAAVPTEPVVVARRNLAPGQAVGAQDVAVQNMVARPRRGYAAVAEVTGKVPVAAIAAGEPLLASHFAAAGSLAALLRPGERAVSVKVDEVIGLGGFAKPGDHVDVLLYLRGEQETGNQSSAQLALADVRVLAFGDVVQEQTGSEEAAPTESPAKDALAAAGVGGKSEAKQQQRTSSRSAVLAVPEAVATRLMLAASSGTLRLALRPAPAAAPLTVAAAAAPRADRQMLRLAELAEAQRPGKASAPRPGIIIHEGDKTRLLAVPTAGRER